MELLELYTKFRDEARQVKAEFEAAGLFYGMMKAEEIEELFNTKIEALQVTQLNVPRETK